MYIEPIEEVKDFKVKQLEWNLFHEDCFTAVAEPVGIYATSRSSNLIELRLSGKTLGKFNSVEEAKNAGQKDFSQKIISALIFL